MSKKSGNYIIKVILLIISFILTLMIEKNLNTKDLNEKIIKNIQKNVDNRIKKT